MQIRPHCQGPDLGSTDASSSSVIQALKVYVKIIYVLYLWSYPIKAFYKISDMKNQTCLGKMGFRMFSKIIEKQKRTICSKKWTVKGTREHAALAPNKWTSKIIKSQNCVPSNMFTSTLERWVAEVHIKIDIHDVRMDVCTEGECATAVVSPRPFFHSLEAIAITYS